MRVALTGLLLLLAGCLGSGSDSTPTDIPPQFAPLQADPLDFGDVVVGETVELLATVRNPVDGFGTEINGFSIPPTDFRYGGFDFPRLPYFLAAGASLSLTIEYTPTKVGPRDAGIIAAHTAGQPVLVDLLANGIPGELPTSLGDVALDPVTRETSDLEVTLPANAISFTIEAFGGTATSPTGGPITLVSLTGPGGRNYVPGAYSTAFTLPTENSVRFQVPNSPGLTVQLVAGGGTYRFRLSNAGGTLQTLRVRVDVEQRTNGTVDEGRLPLNLYLAQGIGLSPTDAANDPRLQGMLAELDAIYSQAGIGIGPVHYITLPDASFDTPAQIPLLMMQSALATQAGMNLFLVTGTTGGEPGGFTAQPGGKTNGTPYSGVYMVYDDALAEAALAARAAHEIGHQLGLIGVADPQSVMNEAAPGALFSPAQAYVMLRHVLVEPGKP